jgi:Tol biopolymer transport system component/C-terminal processing protease CtpA/Prc
MKKLVVGVALILLGAAPPVVEIRGMRHPALSPDARRVAFDWHGDIWICPAEGGPAERVTEDPADEQKPCWSPDGKSLAFSSDRTGNRDLYVIDLATRRIRQLTFHSADDDAPAWSPDGKWIAFQSNRDSNLDLPLNNNVWDLWKVPAEGGTATRVTRFRGENPAWSPDGALIAYDRYSSGYADGEHNIFVINSDGTGVPRELAAGTEDSRHPVFRGRQLFFSHEANGLKQSSSHRNVWRTSVLGGPLMQVTGHGDNEVTWPSTVETGNVLVYERDFGLWSIDPRVPQPKPVHLTVTTEGPSENPEAARTMTSGFHSPAWSPSGSRIAFSCRGQIWTSAADGKDARVVTRGLQDHREPAWLPDGKRIVYVQGLPDQPGQLWCSDVDGSGSRMVLAAEGDYDSLCPSPDGKTLLVTKRNESPPALLSVDLEAGTSRTIPGAASGCFSPDGQTIGCLKIAGNRTAVVTMHLDGSMIRELKNGPGDRSGLRWSPEGSRLVWAEATPQGRQLKTLDLTSLKEETMTRNGRSPSWSPDGTMVVAAVDRGQGPDTQGLTIFDAASSQKLPLEIVATRTVSRREEMVGVFLQVWSAYSSNYYDPFFHGLDWSSVREKYRPLVEECQTKQELYDLINDMIRELRSSHVHLTPAPVTNTVITGSLAVDWSVNPDGTVRIVRVEPNGPAERAGLGEGDVILAAADRALEPGTDLDRLMTREGTEGPPEVKLKVRSAHGEIRELTLKGLDRSALRELKYENRIAARKKLVRERSGGRLAYHHIKMMVAAEVSRLKTSLETECADAEGLILDERDGVGGLAHRPLCSLLDSTAADRLNASPACYTRNRNGSTAPDVYGPGVQGGRASGKSWDKPVIMVQNEISRSDKEILPFTFRHLGIGYLVGMPTAGGVIGGNEWTMRDGSRITVSVQGWFSADGRNLEGYGVPPDYRAGESHEDLMAGRDVPLEKAIEVLLAQMDGKIAPPRKPGAERKPDGQPGK